MRQVELEAVIAGGSANSGGINVKGAMVVGIYTDSDFAGAALAAEVSNDGGSTWFDVQTAAGVDVSIIIGASEFSRLDPADWAFAETLRFVSDGAQGGGTPSTLTVVVLAD
ncbi:hypothetical protein LCGC14_0491110 [marine sediment metagenome]|uniref:Uncharacterized protein n=1 Tax=marine sediment metagenome TaxID=412755 RepID=A0A0F9VFB9_9ZZZZ